MASVKECLKRLTEENIDMSINRHVRFLLENMEESQLIYKLQQQNGVAIDNQMIKLWYYPGIGFLCSNMFQERYGKLPVCGKIERFLNNELSKI
jgi:hypothetical protein